MISSKSKLMVNKFDPARTEQSIFKIQYLIGLSAELIDPVRGFCPILFVDLFHCDSLSGLSKWPISKEGGGGRKKERKGGREEENESNWAMQ